MGGVILLMAGCQAGFRQDRTLITFSTWGSAEEVALIRELLKEFEKERPDIQVELIHIPENYFQKLHILIAGDLTPDVMFINSLSFQVYADNHVFAPLDYYLANPKGALQRETFFEPALKALSWKDQLYAIPRDVSNLVVFYNKDLFDAAGLEPPYPDWTLADMLALARQLTRDVDGDGIRDQFGVSFYGKPPLFWLPFVWSEGGHLFDETLSLFFLTHPASIDGLQFYADLRNKWHVAPTRKEVGSASMSQLFLQGDLAMMVSGRWSVPVLRQQAKFAWDVVPFPRGQHGSVVGIDASGYAISASTRYPKASWALVEFLSSRKAQEAFSASGLIVPARQDVAHSPEFLAKPPEHGHYFIDVIEHGQPSHTPVRWNEIAEELGVALEPVWEGTRSAEEAVRRVKPRIEKLLE